MYDLNVGVRWLYQHAAPSSAYPLPEQFRSSKYCAAKSLHLASIAFSIERALADTTLGSGATEIVA